MDKIDTFLYRQKRPRHQREVEFQFRRQENKTGFANCGRPHSRIDTTNSDKNKKRYPRINLYPIW